ncbi:MAG: DUF4175 family protein [candidate division KSB1 bacterium]|nr:DUF4175 family protein [candidate division KSB1 bacterium]
MSLIRGLLCFAAIAIVVILTSLAIVHFFRISSIARQFSVYAMLGILIVSLFYYALRHIFDILMRKESPDDDSIASRIGNAFPGIRDGLLNTIQIYGFHRKNREGYSLPLVDRALTATDSATRDKEFTSILNRGPLYRALRIFSIVLVVAGAILILFNREIKEAAFYMLHPNEAYATKSEFDLRVYPGSIEVIKNTDVEIGAIAEGKNLPDRLLLFSKNVVNGNESRTRVPMNRDSSYTYLIENIKDSVEYVFSSGPVRSAKHLISVVELPLVRNLQARITYPEYSGLSPEMLDENVGDITALRGSMVDVRLETNKIVESAHLVFGDSGRKKMAVTGKRVSGRFRVMSDSTYYIRLTDDSGRNNADPIDYRVRAISDQYPTVKIIIPARDVDITEEMALDLEIIAEDDFGFSSARIAYKKMKSNISNEDSVGYVTLPVNSQQEGQLGIRHTWDLKPLDLFPEDIVSYYVEVFDNDVVSGPKSAKTASYTIRFPSMEEIFTEVQQEHEDAFDAIEGMYEHSKSLKEKVSELVQEMKKDPNLNWEEKEKLEDVAESQQQMQQQLESLEQRLEQMVERLEKNELLSVETLEKYQELQDLMQELMTPELKEALKELQKAMEEIDPEQLKKAVEKLNMNQRNFLENLEKMLSMLKRLQIEQKLDALAKKAEDLVNQQKELMENAENASENEGQQMSEEQNSIADKTEELKAGIEDLKKSMSEFDDMPEELMEEALEFMDQENMQQNMRSASQDFKSGNMKSAKGKGSQAQSSLTGLSNMLNTAKEEFLQSQKRQVAKALKSLSKDLIYLSMKQEKVLHSSEGLDRNSPHIQKMADQQQNLLSGLNRVADKAGELSQQSFFMSPEIMKAIGQSMSSMNQCLSRFEERNTSSAVNHQGLAMASMNDAVKQLMSAMDDLSSSSSASGLQQMLDRLKSMSCQQQGINQQTMQMGMGQALSLQQQAAMARLAAEQAALKKSLEQLQNEFGNRSDILGRMDNIAEEMEDVIKDMQQRNVNRKTIDRQRKILSRLLDAQKSIQRRDYSKKRKAETGKQYFVKSPSQLPADLGEREKQLRQDLLEAVKQGYTKDYQELIKRYFEALSDESINK